MWVFPALGNQLYFVRVPLTLLIYWETFYSGAWPKRGGLIFAAYAFTFLCILIVLIQAYFRLSFGNEELLVAAVGMYNYCFYLFLAAILACRASQETISIVTKTLLVLMIINCPVSVVQFWAPASSWLNSGISLDPSAQFHSLGIALGHVRPSGTFTASNGLAALIPFTFATLIAFVLVSPRRRSIDVSARLMWVAAFAAAVALAFCGSRNVYAAVAIVLIFGVFAGLLCGSNRALSVSLMLPAAAATIVVIVFPLVFPTSTEAFAARIQSADASEADSFLLGPLGRGLYYIFNFVYYFDSTPFFGHLLGIASNAVGRSATVSLPPEAALWREAGGWGGWAEVSFSKHIVELGPVVGSGFIVFRMLILTSSIRLGLLAARNAGNPYPLVMASLVLIYMLFFQITSQGTDIGICWIFVGMFFAICRLESTTDQSRCRPSAPS
ncbi:MAG: hypothetical protein Pyrs2KO_30220 [Pyruvatibacter sp.]